MPGVGRWRREALHPDYPVEPVDEEVKESHGHARHSHLL
ncbi:MAG: hypothetical protein AVDCRST_MAG03-3694 [uncultured Rubrobacteraceae bacterium]|uniref:Uncharacterized protein n=1 Tax=uncultured Rubrobacteraceae bacterium TaxID=349277 RepID=A0A6J4QGS6_9ACTN|nr:MAG: hypothetical protein AVDCRST_MAG03-3694 [uncultured Rubrobacteraceae bacterium]